MRKKILVTAMMAVMAVQLAGCGKGQEETAEKPVGESEMTATELQDEAEKPVEESEMIPAGLQDVDEAAATEEVLPEEAEEEEAGVQFVSWEEAGLEDHVMDWKDDILKWQMQSITEKEEIMLSDVWELTSLHLTVSPASSPDRTISDISALSELKNLTELFLSNHSVSDISALAELPNLVTLDLDNNSVSDISALSELRNLTHLYLSGNGIHDISDLSGLKNLEVLDVRDDPRSISPLAQEEMVAAGFNINYNAISDFSVVLELPNLREVYWEGNPVEDMSPLETMRENK